MLTTSNSEEMRHVFKIVYSLGKDELAQLAKSFGLLYSGTKPQLVDQLLSYQPYVDSVLGKASIAGALSHDDDYFDENPESRSLDLDNIGPNEHNFYDKTRASKLVIIAKPGVGKSFTIASILFHMRHKIPYGIILNGTEDTSHEFEKFFPSTFVYDSYSEEPIRKLIERQKILINAKKENPWALLVINDCAFGGFFKSALQQELFKNARHWYILYIVALQFPKDIPLQIRAAVDMTFILRENNKILRRIIYDNYASVIPTFSQFEKLMRQFTQKYGILVVDNISCTESWVDNVFYYKSLDLANTNWRFGWDNFWEYHWQITGQK